VSRIDPELRKAALETLGWKHAANCNGCAIYSDGSGCQWFDLEGMLHDGPQITEDMFVEWAERKEFYWRLTTTPHRPGYACRLYRAFTVIVHAEGSTPDEARMRAICQAVALAVEGNNILAASQPQEDDGGAR
jgi:hypothetical protein